MVSFDDQRVFLGLPLVDFQDKKRKSMILFLISPSISFMIFQLHITCLSFLDFLALPQFEDINR